MNSLASSAVGKGEQTEIVIGFASGTSGFSYEDLNNRNQVWGLSRALHRGFPLLRLDRGEDSQDVFVKIYQISTLSR